MNELVIETHGLPQHSPENFPAHCHRCKMNFPIGQEEKILIATSRNILPASLGDQTGSPSVLQGRPKGGRAPLARADA